MGIGHQMSFFVLIRRPELENSQKITFLQFDQKNQTLINCAENKSTNQPNFDGISGGYVAGASGRLGGAWHDPCKKIMLFF